MTTITNTKRAIPTIQKFYQTKAATHTYTRLLLRSGFNPDTQTRYFDLGRENISTMVQDFGIGRMTFYRHLDSLIEAGVINKENNTIYFSSDLIYTLIEKETLEFLLNSTNQYVIGVYAELSWRWEYFNKKGQKAFFTQSLLLDILGLTNQGTNHKKIRDILTLLKLSGLVDWESHKTHKGNVVMALTKLEKHIKPITVEVNSEVIQEEEVEQQLKLTPAQAAKEFGGKF